MAFDFSWKSYLKIPSWMRISSKGVEETLMSLNLSPGSKVLDVGCGYGRISLFLKEKGFSVIGVDSDEDMVERNKDKFDCRLMDGRNLEFSNNSFDLVVTDGILEHFEKPEDIIKEEFRVAKKYVVNFVPTNSWWNRILEVVQMTPAVYWRSADKWVEKHRIFKNVERKRLLRLDAFICVK